MYIRPILIVLVTVGLGWLAADVYMTVGNVVPRETRFGVIAELIDRLPLKTANPIFLLLWAVLLLGWTVRLIVGFRWLLRQKRSN